MVPEFDVKQIDNRLSSDTPSHLYTWLIIGSMIGFFILRGGFRLEDILKFGFVIGLILLQSLTRYIPVVKTWKAFASGGIGALLIYNGAVDLLFIWFLPLYSPFILAIPIIMYITIYYRGIMSYLVSLASLTVLVIIISIKGGGIDSQAVRFFPYLTIILGAAYGGIIQRASTIEAEVRKEFNRISQKVSQEQQELSSLINSIGDTVVAIDTKGLVLFYNAGALDMLNTNSSLTGRPINELFVLHNKVGKVVDLLKLANGQTTFTSRDLFLMTSSQEKIHLYLEINPIRSNYNKWQQAGYIMLLRDITKEKTLDEERDEFVAVTSHELRTPIAIVEANLSTAMTMKEIKTLEGAPKQLLDQTYTTVLELAKLVNELSLLTQAEQVGLADANESIDVIDLLSQLVRQFADKASKKSLTLHLSTPESLPKLMANKLYLTRIIENFISNAIKYTPEGSINVSVAEDEENGLVFSVSDTGIGIGKSDKEHIFEKFYRSEDYQIRQTGGTGLGLYIAQKLSGYIHGKIWFESQLGQGSIFYLKIPLLVSQPGALHAANHHSAEA